MALRAKIATQDEFDKLTEAVKAHCTRRGDAWFLVLDKVDNLSLEDVGGLRSALENENEEVRALKGKLATYGERPRSGGAAGRRVSNGMNRRVFSRSTGRVPGFHRGGAGRPGKPRRRLRAGSGGSEPRARERSRRPAFGKLGSDPELESMRDPRRIVARREAADRRYAWVTVRRRAAAGRESEVHGVQHAGTGIA
jgi:hypothetical protein